MVFSGLNLFSKFSHRKEANNSITGLEIADATKNRVLATQVFFRQPLNLKGKRPCLQIKGTICLKRSVVNIFI